MLEKGFTQYIREIKLTKSEDISKDEYPFNLKAIKNLKTLELHPNVTFIVGENGSGKSTLLEAIAIAYGFNAEGGSKNFTFATNETHSILYEHIKVVKGFVKPRDGYFLRAESFYNVATNIDEMGDLVKVYGGKSLHMQSHGESFMSLVMNRITGEGIYIFDEPEAALSPTRQMALVSRIHQLVKMDSQLIIATHSPIIMSYPNAIIYNIEDKYNEIEYEKTEHYMVTKNYLNRTDMMLEKLLED